MKDGYILARQRRAANRKAAFTRIIARLNEIIVGNKYFLSSFYDKDGAWVNVLATSTKINRCGWPSTVTYEVIEPVGESYGYYVTGKTGTCNASNLYETREAASHRRIS